MLRDREVRMRIAEGRRGSNAKEEGGGRRGSAGVTGGETLRVDGIEFEVCPIVVVQAGYAI
jgi:hypothetical protein